MVLTQANIVFELIGGSRVAFHGGSFLKYEDAEEYAQTMSKFLGLLLDKKLEGTDTTGLQLLEHIGITTVEVKLLEEHTIGGEIIHA